LNLKSEEQYYNYLKLNPEEVDAFLDNFTVNYSYFFRNYEIFTIIQEYIDKYHLTKNKTIKIWSCPCANGEEPYSLAMLFEELKMKRSNFPEYKIVASDINTQAIDNAKNGIYGTHALHETPNYYREKYFTQISTDPPKYQISKEIRSRVEFICEDITICHKKSQKYDIILCRNFIIYINILSREKLIRNLKTYLNDGGILVMGKTETIDEKKTFKLIDPVNHFYIKKGLSFEPVSVSQKEKVQISEENSVNEFIERSQTFKMQKSSKRKNQKPERSNIPLKEKNKIKKINKKVKKPISIKKTEELIDLSKIIADPPEQEFYEKQKKQLEDFREKVNKELFFLKQQRKKLNQAIMKFKKEKKRFEKEKRNFENKLLVFEKEKEHIKRKWELYENKRELLRIEKETFRKKVEHFEKEKKRFQQTKSMKNRVTQKKISQTNSKLNYKTIKDYILPLGKYIVESKNDQREITNISMHGIGSTYVIVLCDDLNEIHAMSHVMYSKPKEGHEKKNLNNKHQYAEYCVPYLIKKMLIKGASEKEIHAYILGGAQIFKKRYKSVENIIKIIREELKKYNIPIKTEHIGGSKSRNIKFNIQKKFLSINTGDNSEKIKF